MLKNIEYRGNFGLAPALFLALGLAACSEAASTPEAPPPVVRTMPVMVRPDVVEHRFPGVVTARHEGDQGFRVSGKIVERLVDVGDRVSEGETLARLDTADLDLQVESAEAEFGAASAAVDQASLAEQRAAKLLASNNLSTADSDQRKLALEEARGRLTRAERQLSLARNQSSYATLKSSVAGVVTAAAAEPGQVVAAGQTVVTVARVDALEVTIAIPESEVVDLASAKAGVTLWANDGHEYQATLRELAPQADATARTYAARFGLKDADDNVRLGMSATLVLRRGSGSPVARVPLSAIFNQGTGASVFAVDASGKLSLNPVDVIRYEASDAVISAGVADGERIVTLGVNKLEAGLKVRVADVR